jgi:hypothetical protein
MSERGERLEEVVVEAIANAGFAPTIEECRVYAHELLPVVLRELAGPMSDACGHANDLASLAGEIEAQDWD